MSKTAVAAFKKVIKLQKELDTQSAIINKAIVEKFGDVAGLSNVAGDGWCIDIEGGFGCLTRLSPELLERWLLIDIEEAILQIKSQSI